VDKLVGTLHREGLITSHLLTQPLITGKPAFKFGASPTYTLGSGTGALANRPICRGELIHVEQPLVVQQVDQILSAHSIFVSLCVHPTDLQEAYLSLPNAFPNTNGSDVANVDTLVGIFNSNCLPLGPAAPCPLPSSYSTASSEQAHGVFLTLSKFNTSCRPNAALSWDEKRHVMAVYGIEPIPLGEEITICYGQPLFAMCAERREYLRRVKGFWCVCRCCALQGEEERASDRRRAELCRLFRAVPFLGHDASAGLRAVSSYLSSTHPWSRHILILFVVPVGYPGASGAQCGRIEPVSRLICIRGISILHATSQRHRHQWHDDSAELHF
jgi:hypothetical protein